MHSCSVMVVRSRPALWYTYCMTYQRASVYTERKKKNAEAWISGSGSGVHPTPIDVCNSGAKVWISLRNFLQNAPPSYRDVSGVLVLPLMHIACSVLPAVNFDGSISRISEKIGGFAKRMPADNVVSIQLYSYGTGYDT